MAVQNINELYERYIQPLPPALKWQVVERIAQEMSQGLAEAEATSVETSKEELRQSFLERLRRGVDFGTTPLPTREELYADRLRNF
jgi:hypothetical protein